MPEPAADGFPLPPDCLIARAGATPGADVVAEYLAGAAGMKQQLMSILALYSGTDASAAPRILDFGCGAGNVLRHFGSEARRGEVWGCDIDRSSIAWLEQNLCPSFRVFTVAETTGLPQPDNYFDLIYAISVFTHIADDWAAWLLELHRALKPDGIVMATFLGEGMVEVENAGAWDPDRIGMNVLRHGQDWDGGGPTVLHSDWWLRAHWGRAFEILEIHHDRDAAGAVVPGTHGYVVMRKRKAALTPAQLTELEPDEPREVMALLRNIGQLHHDDRHLRELLIGAMQRGDQEHAWRVEAEAKLLTLSRSRSWRLTRPLRSVAQRLRRRRAAPKGV